MHINDTFTSVLLAIVVIGALVYRQLHPRRLSTRGLVLIPLIILYLLIQALPSFHPTATKITEIIITIVVTLVLGLLACRQLKVYASPKTGKAMASGSMTYFLWWIAAFIVKGALSVAFGETSLNQGGQVEILVPLFILVATRNAYLYSKTYKLGITLHGRGD